MQCTVSVGWKDHVTALLFSYLDVIQSKYHTKNSLLPIPYFRVSPTPLEAGRTHDRQLNKKMQWQTNQKSNVSRNSSLLERSRAYSPNLRTIFCPVSPFTCCTHITCESCRLALKISGHFTGESEQISFLPRQTTCPFGQTSFSTGQITCPAGQFKCCIHT